MKQLVIILAVLVLGLLVPACGGGDPYENAAKDAHATMNDFVEVLEGITDKASAEASKEELRALGERMNAVQERMDALEDPSEEQVAALEEKYPMEEVAGQMMSEMLRVSMDPEIGPVLQDAMGALEPGN